MTVSLVPPPRSTRRPPTTWGRTALMVGLALVLGRLPGEAVRFPDPPPAPARPFRAQPAGLLAPPANLAPPAATGVLVGRGGYSTTSRRPCTRWSRRWPRPAAPAPRPRNPPA